MTSIRQIAKCIGISGNISIVHDFYGFSQPLSILTLLSSSTSHFLSLLTQVRLLQGRLIHLNLILTGIDPADTSKRTTIDNAVHRMRTTYAQANIGVGRIMYFELSSELANGYDIISSDSEAEDLTNEWTVHNNGLDVFIVNSSWTDSGSTHLGISPVTGPCNKDDNDGFSGSVISLSGFQPWKTLAHELGHYLGLPHFPDIDAEDVTDLSDFSSMELSNLMFPGGDHLHGMELLEPQGMLMKTHCFALPGC